MMSERTVDGAEVRPRRLLGWGALFFGCFGRDAGSKRWSRRGAWAAVFPFVGVLARFVLDGRASEAMLDTTLAVSVGSAIAFVYWTTWRYIQDLDEMHQRIMLEAFTLSFFVTMTFVVTLGMFGLTRRTTFDVLWVYVVAEILRGLGLMLAARKYR